jgi:hypothetical protein
MAARQMRSKFGGECTVCSKPIAKGEWIRWEKGKGAWHDHCHSQHENLKDPEYARGYHDTKRVQEAGPAGSEAREAAYLEMELQWAREGFDG